MDFYNNFNFSFNENESSRTIPVFGKCVVCNEVGSLTTMCKPGTNSLMCKECWMPNDFENDSSYSESESGSGENSINPKRSKGSSNEFFTPVSSPKRIILPQLPKVDSDE